MKNWKEAPHLFANGKFKVEWTHHGYVDEMNLHKEFWMVRESKVLENSKLIARPISDMSDEEMQEYYIKRLGMEAILSTDAFLYLLSIGVYPFDQDHFESGEVITRYENNNKK